MLARMYRPVHRLQDDLDEPALAPVLRPAVPDVPAFLSLVRTPVICKRADDLVLGAFLPEAGSDIPRSPRCCRCSGVRDVSSGALAPHRSASSNVDPVFLITDYGGATWGPADWRRDQAARRGPSAATHPSRGKTHGRPLLFTRAVPLGDTSFPLPFRS